MTKRINPVRLMTEDQRILNYGPEYLNIVEEVDRATEYGLVTWPEDGIEYVCVNPDCRRTFSTEWQWFFHHCKHTPINKEGTEKMAKKTSKHPSNRSFMKQMIVWGYEPTGKSRQDEIAMRAPNGAVIYVKAPNIHDANASSTLRKALRLIDPSLTWEQFWEKRPVEEATEDESSSSENGATYREGSQTAVLYDHMKNALPNKLTISDLVMRTGLDVEQIRKAVHRIKKEKGLDVAPEEVIGSSHYQRRVFDYMQVNKGMTLSAERVASVLDLTLTQAFSALSRLARKGVLYRIGSGMYRYGPEIQYGEGDPMPAPDTVAAFNFPIPDAVVTPPEAAVVALTVPEASPVSQNANTAPVAPQKAPEQKGEDPEELMDDILDLLFPEGFRAKHLRAIDAWRQATMDLLRTVAGN